MRWPRKSPPSSRSSPTARVPPRPPEPGTAMNPLDAYRQQAVAASTRIDLLLAMYDGAIERIAVALNHLREGNGAAATPHIVRAQLIVSGLSTGVVPNVAPEM